jgi:hypothetical protein
MEATTNPTTIHDLAGSYTAERVTTGHAYARSGNAHNATPRYRYDVRDPQGRRVGTTSTLRGARDLAAIHSEETS